MHRHGSRYPLVSELAFVTNLVAKLGNSSEAIQKARLPENLQFLKDGYTTLPETDDRIMATSLDVKWRYAGTDADWDGVYASARTVMIEQFATLHSLALQQTLWHMGSAVLDAHPEVVEIRLKAPNKHHFDYDIARFGVEQHGEVFHADDRPYGLIEATISREDAPDPHEAWHASLGAA